MSVSDNRGVLKPTISSYLWEVKNYNVLYSCKKNNDYLMSPVFSTTFSTNLANKQEWCLWLYPKGYTKKNNDHTSIYIEYLGQTDINAHVTLSLVNDKYQKVVQINTQKLFKTTSKDAFAGSHRFAEQQFVLNKNKQVLVNDTMNILCEIIYDSNLAVPFKNNCAERNLLLTVDFCRLKEFDEYERLLETENSADVTVLIDEQKIKVHKAIITNRSSVFKAELEENNRNVIEITDIKYEVMKEVFRFIYVGRVNEIETIAGDLLAAAEKYCIKGLVALCQKHLLQNLSIDNAIEYLKLAEKCNAYNLKSMIIRFIVTNAKAIVHKPELKLLPSEVICDVLAAVVDNNSNE